MKATKKKAKLMSLFLAIYMMLSWIPCQPALGEIIGTERMMDMVRAQEARDRVNSILAREDVRSALVAQGIEPLEAKARVNSLSDAEIIMLSDKIDALPAGGSTFETVLIVALIAFLILLFTDIAGYTDVFPFVKKR